MAVLMAAVIALISLFAVAVASLGLVHAARVQAVNAADAAALAAAVATYPGTGRAAPVELAGFLASSNGARLSSCVCRVNRTLEIRRVEVVTIVTVDVPLLGRLAIRGVSRAEFDPRRWLGR